MTTKADWLKEFGGVIVCPCCGVDAATSYGSRLHKWDCKLEKFNARLHLYEGASAHESSDWHDAPGMEHLRDDVPFLVCTDCGRKSWGSKAGDGCNMPQPDGSRCCGTFHE